MRRAAFLALLAVGALLFGVGFSECDPHPSCANPTVLTGDQGTLDYPPYKVQQDVWTGQGSQTMYVCGPGDWKAVANQTGAPETGVKTYPDTAKTYTDWQFCASQPTLGSFTSLSSSYATVTPSVGAWDAAYDIFLNGAICGKPTIEVMIWNQWRGISVPTAQLHPVIAGVAYDFYRSGNYYQFRRQTQTTAATVNVLAVLQYLRANGFLSSADTLQFVQYGFEVLTTYGDDVPFSLTGFSVTDARN